MAKVVDIKEEQKHTLSLDQADTLDEQIRRLDAILAIMYHATDTDSEIKIEHWFEMIRLAISAFDKIKEIIEPIYQSD
ncbi:MAG: hypothetical protein IBX72_02990 [Nitrospirae bacterium]|jgi:hypothetical protein|nr:hypothetical protein [Nitrospirota bacterium]